MPHAGVDCSKEVINATLTWLKVGGRRIDNGDSYEDMHAIGEAMKASGIPRKEIFLVTKIGEDEGPFSVLSSPLKRAVLQATAASAWARRTRGGKSITISRRR